MYIDIESGTTASLIFNRLFSLFILLVRGNIHTNINRPRCRKPSPLAHIDMEISCSSITDLDTLSLESLLLPLSTVCARSSRRDCAVGRDDALPRYWRGGFWS